MTAAADEYALGEDGPVYLTTAELAARLRMSPSAIRDWRARGEGPLGIKPGKKVLYPLPEVEAYERSLVEAAKRDHRRRATGLRDVSGGAR